MILDTGLTHLGSEASICISHMTVTVRSSDKSLITTKETINYHQVRRRL